MALIITITIFLFTGYVIGTAGLPVVTFLRNEGECD